MKQLTREQVLDNMRDIRNGKNVVVDNQEQLAQMCYHVDSANHLYVEINEQGNQADIHDTTSDKTATITTKSANTSGTGTVVKTKTETK